MVVREFEDRHQRATLWPLLKSEWVGCAEERPVGAVKGGRSPAQRTLDGDRRTLQSSQAECGMVLHSAMEARACECRTNCLKPLSALPNRGTCGASTSMAPGRP